MSAHTARLQSIRLLLLALLVTLAACRATAEDGLFAGSQQADTGAGDVPTPIDTAGDTSPADTRRPTDASDTDAADTDASDTDAADTDATDTAVDSTADTRPVDAAVGDSTGGDVPTDVPRDGSPADTETGTETGTDTADAGCPSGETRGDSGRCRPRLQCPAGEYRTAGGCVPIPGGSKSTRVDTGSLIEHRLTGDRWMALWASDRIVALPKLYDMHTRSMTPQSPITAPRAAGNERRWAVWADRGADHTAVIWGASIQGYDPMGGKRWGGIGTGCCNYNFRQPPAIDVALGIGYQKIKDYVFSFNVRNGAALGSVTAKIDDGTHLCVDQRIVWALGSTQIAHVNFANRKTDWVKKLSTPSSPGRLGPCALAFDGSLVTTSPSGKLFRVRPDATLAWPAK